MSQLEMRLPSPVKPEVIIGVASPLWGYYTGAAMAGVAFWWMTKLIKPSSLEAMMAAARPAARPSGEAVAEALIAGELPALPVGGEAAPFGAVTLEAQLLSEPALAGDLMPAEPEAFAEPSQEFVADLAPDDPAELAPQPQPRPKPRKSKSEAEPKPH